MVVSFMEKASFKPRIEEKEVILMMNWHTGNAIKVKETKTHEAAEINESLIPETK